MMEMNPFYAHASSSGPVFDVATWSGRKMLAMALFALPLGLGLLAVALFFWSPDLLFQRPPEPIKELSGEILKLHRQHAWARPVGAGVLGLVGWFFLAAGISSIGDCLRGDFHFRVGPGGFALRVPFGIDLTKLGLTSTILDLDLPWEEVTHWTVVQVKQLGSLSRNAGNIGGHLKLKTADGQRYEISLDCFREPAFIIHSKIQDALQMTAASLGGPSEQEDLVGAGFTD